MAGRRRSGGAEAVTGLVALLPWWGGVALAVVAYFGMHALAVLPQPAAVQPAQMGPWVVRAMVAAVASALQYVLPVLCLLAALISFLKRRKRQALATQVTRSGSAEALHQMSWREFELLVGEAFRLQGYQVTEHGGAQADGGVDLVLRRGTETFLVQCKQWKALKVGVDVVRELYGVMAARGAAGGFVVTSGEFTQDAQAFAGGRNIMLVGGAKLFGLIVQARHSLRSPAHPSAGDGPAATPAADPPQCPACNAAMVRRRARKGSLAGLPFWGCSRFPACRGTR